MKTELGGTALELLGSLFSGMLTVGFLYSLGPGLTASPSELDFVMTTQIRPREYLVSDMMFQFLSLGISGGLAGFLALFGIVYATGKSFSTLPLLMLVLLAYVFMILMIVQILVVARIRNPNAHVRGWTMLLLALSLMPAVHLAAASFPLRFEGLPIPQTGYAEIVNSILVGGAPSALAIISAIAYPCAIAAIWYALSSSYIFQGVQPTLSAGLGQINLSARQAQQRRLISGLGGVTTRIALRSETGSDLSFMTRLHIVRILRDGSLLFVGLLVVIATVPNYFSGGSAAQSNGSIGVSEIMTFPIGILALNWAYYGSTDLWLVASAGKSLVSYFRGMMIALAAVVGAIALVLTVILGTVTVLGLSVSSFVFPLVSPIAASTAATSMLTKLKFKPGAFSPALLALILITVLVGVLAGFVALWAVNAAGPSSTALGVIAQGTVLVVLTAAATAGGLWLVGKLANGYVVYD